MTKRWMKAERTPTTMVYDAAAFDSKLARQASRDGDKPNLTRKGLKAHISM